MKRSEKILIAIAVLGIFAPIVLCVCGLITMGTVTELNIIPNTRIVEGHELRASDKDYIRDLVQFDDDETIQYFYSTGMLSIEGEGQAVTDRRVISYEEDLDGHLVVWQARYEDIGLIEPEYSDNLLEDTGVLIYPLDDDGFYILLSNEDDWDHTVVEYIEARIEELGGT